MGALLALQSKHGDVDVYIHNDMIADDPDPTFVAQSQFYG